MTAMSAFITARKGFCYLTIKHNRRNFDMMRVRNYKLEPDEKRHMRRLYPDVIFDWKKISAQLVQKRDACRRYRSRRRNHATSRPSPADESFYGVFEPLTRTVYVNQVPSNAASAGALLDAVLFIDTISNGSPPPSMALVEPIGRPESARALPKHKGRAKPR